MTDTKKADQTASPKKTHVDHTIQESLIKAASAFSKQPGTLAHLLAGESLNRLNAVQVCQEPESGSMNVITLIQHQSEARVDSRLVADQLKTDHASTIKMIRKYLADFQEIGPIGFEIQKGKPLPQGGFARSTEFALLNEDQAYLLLTYSRNTPRVRALKVSLVKAFREARYGHACQVLEARKKEASQSGRRLAHWRYDKPGMHQHVTHLREQLKLTLELEGVH